MRAFFKENLVLVVGTLLPIVILVLFGLAIWVPSLFVKPPKYNLLFSVGQFYDTGYQFTVVNGKLQIQYSCTRGCNNKNPPLQKLFLVDTSVRAVKNIPIAAPVIPPNTPNFSTPVNISEVANWNISPALEAPDGYRFSAGDNSRSFLLDIFSYAKPTIMLYKKGNTVSIPVENNIYSYYDIHFLGWIIGEGK